MSDATWKPGQVPTAEDVKRWEDLGMLCYWWRRDSIAGVEAVAVSFDENEVLVFQAPGDEGCYPVARSPINWVGPVSPPRDPDGVALARLVEAMLGWAWPEGQTRAYTGDVPVNPLAILKVLGAARAILAKVDGEAG